MHTTSGERRRKRGAVLFLVSVALFALMAVAALAIDLAMLKDARAEAQRAADAAALAGADAFRDFPGQPEAVPEARDNALEIAAANEVRRKAIDVGNATEATNSYAWGTVTTVQTNNVTLNIIPDSNRVRVWVRPPAGITTFFARTFGWGMGAVQAMATAEASPDAPRTPCLKPFLMPDMWYEASRGPGQQDQDSDGMLDAQLADHDGGELWYYEPDQGDYYVRYDVENAESCTGYGCGRGGYDNDWGTPMMIKPQQGNAQRQGNWYYTLDGEEKNLRDQIKFGCIDAEVGEEPEPEQGGKTGQARQGGQYLVDQDPGARWDEGTKSIVGSAYANWTQSPRTIIIGLFDPIHLVGVSSKNEKIPPGVEYSNFMRVWLEEVDHNENIMVRFLGFAPGAGGGTEPGTIVLRLRLIQ